MASEVIKAFGRVFVKFIENRLRIGTTLNIHVLIQSLEQPLKNIFENQVRVPVLDLTMTII